MQESNSERYDAKVAAIDAAASLSGVICRLSAAVYWGWSTKHVPQVPQLTLSKDRRLRTERREGVELRWLDLRAGDVSRGLVTSPVRTVLDCARHYPFDEGLCVADSALRAGVSRAELCRRAREARGPGAARIKLVLKHADGRSTNAFESVLRSITIGVDHLEAVPQAVVRAGRYVGRPDLVDERLGIIIEADSFEFHGSPAALTRDARRYNAFVAAGWIVLRFTWFDVMQHPERVRAVLEAVVTDRLMQLGQVRGEMHDFSTGGPNWSAAARRGH